MSKDSDDDDGAKGLNEVLNKQDGSDDDDDKDSGKSEDEGGSEYSDDDDDESDVDESDAEAKNGKLLAKQFLEGLPYFEAPGGVKDNIRTEPRMKEPTDTFTPFNGLLTPKDNTPTPPKRESGMFRSSSTHSVLRTVKLLSYLPQNG